MDNTKFTKGKWEVVEHSWSDTSLVCGNYTIATKSIYDEATEDNQDELEIEVQYNFKLLSKAPEMLEMLKKCKEAMFELICVQEGWDDDYEDLEKLIKEATEL